MPTFLLAMLTFGVVVGAGFLLMQPVFTQYVDTYAVRVRPRKEKEETVGEQPKDSTLLILCRTVGELVLSLLPGLADKRTVQLLTQGNYRTQAHLAIFIGIKSIVAATAIFVGLLGA